MYKNYNKFKNKSYSSLYVQDLKMGKIKNYMFEGGVMLCLH